MSAFIAFVLDRTKPYEVMVESSNLSKGARNLYLLPMTIDYTANTFPMTEEYCEMDKFTSCLSDIVTRMDSGFDDEFEIDQMITREVNYKTEAAILDFYKITDGEMEDWKDANAEVAHWVISVASSMNPSSFPELEEYILEFEEDEELVAA